jgi:hypothetical protein
VEYAKSVFASLSADVPDIAEEVPETFRLLCFLFARRLAACTGI